jgi:hypothetical protein
MEKNIVCAIKRRPEIDSRRGPGRQLSSSMKIRYAAVIQLFDVFFLLFLKSFSLFQLLISSSRC